MARRSSAFDARLRDLLSTLEPSAVLASAERRVRGLAEQLQFACMAFPCEEALVAIELEALGRLVVPGIATADNWRQLDFEFFPVGTPFAHLLAGGAGYAVVLEAGDTMLGDLGETLEQPPRGLILCPLRLGAQAVGGMVLVRHSAVFDEAHLAMAERLAEVLAMTMEAYRTDRMLLELFATALPGLFSDATATGFAELFAKHLHQLRVAPTHRQRVRLALAAAELASLGTAETDLATDILQRVKRYADGLGEGDGDDWL